MVLSISEIFENEPGKGINAAPYEAEALINFTGPPGSMTGVYYGLMFQLGKWGFQTAKVDEWINVSPVFKQYYELTLQQKQALEMQIKAGLGQIATAIHDYELVFHDLRKYREFLDHFSFIEEGKRLIKEGKKEEGEKKEKEGEQTLKAIFIDEVDVHTDLPNTPIALRSIVGRWPTIIADFMRLDDSDTNPQKIKDKYHISEAQGVVLATKNKLFIEWRDKLFRPTVEERYDRILRLTESRKFSIDEYTRMLKPVVARFKMMRDALETPGGRADTITSFFRPDAQAFSIDFMRLWAWKPFSPSEKYKITREFLDEISPRKAGFTKEEVEELTEIFKNKEEKGLSYDEKMFLHDKKVLALPVEPSVGHKDDDVVRQFFDSKDGKPSKIEREYNVKIGIEDLFDARSRLTESYRRRAADAWSPETGAYKATASGRWAVPGEGWVFSPYFVFIDLPLQRTMLKIPDGSELEDLWIENLRTVTKTQNVIIVHLLEVIAREKQLENYISQLVGETGGKDLKDFRSLKPIEELKKEEYPQIFGELKKIKEKEPTDLTKPIKKIKHVLGDVLRSFGLTTPFVDYLRARGPYEFALDDRLTEIYQPGPGELFSTVKNYLLQAIGVPGVRW